jgi:hypothetical protein
MKGVHNRLAFVVESDEENPRKTEKEDETIQGQEGGKSGFLGFFSRSVKPENLGKDHKGDGTIAGIK